MKYAWIYTQDCPVTNKVIGDIERVSLEPAWDIFLVNNGWVTPVEFDETLIDENFLVASLVEGVWTITEDTSAKTAADKAQQVADAYAVMNADVYAAMYTLFGTNNPDSAVAYERTWSLMKSNPASFVGINAELSTEQAVTDYADTKIAAALAYSVWRIQRIEQFRDLRSSILAE